MNLVVNQLAKSLTGKASISDCSRQELQQLAAQYPFFGPAQLLLLKKLGMETEPIPAGMRERTALYFPNPLWMTKLLEEDADPPLSAEEPVAEPAPEVMAPARDPVPVEDSPPATEKEAIAAVTTNDIPMEGEDDEQELPVVDSQAPELLLRIPSLEIEPIDPSKAELVFEPYHTVDYFASQGVQIKEDEKPKDRFSLQLKSFTEWLKTMKRQSPAEISAAATVSVNEEQKVEQLAQHSIDDREVVTEAMAEVWEKQGNHDRARDVYRKLSLLDPAKSSYFAAKIEQLKQS